MSDRPTLTNEQLMVLFLQLLKIGQSDNTWLKGELKDLFENVLVELGMRVFADISEVSVDSDVHITH